MSTSEETAGFKPPEKGKGGNWKRRETWEGKFDFLVACVGTCVGLGNVWRFPYLCYRNGGGAFLIPYLLCLFLVGFPLVYLEMAVGQYMTRGGPKAWSMVPLFQGIGLASFVIAFFLTCYYNVILAWAFYYLFSSFSSKLPWMTCHNYWNTQNCSDDFAGISTANSSGQFGKNLTDPVTEFWENKVLRISGGLAEVGIIKWDLALCLLFAWIIVFCCVCKGIKCSGKIMYLTATSPYIFIFILIIRNCTLDGSMDGIEFYLKPNMTKLKESMVWEDAGTQVFFSWTIGQGCLGILGSYNKFKHNSLRDALVISAVNASSSFLAGFMVFTILGFMAKQHGVLVSDVAESGPGLAFVAYPKAVAQLPVSPLWSILFFMVILLLGLDSQFVNTESVITAIVDQYPHILRIGYRREIFIGILCFLMFLMGIMMVTEGGMYVFQIFDYYTGSRIVLLVALCEIIAVCYCYGLKRFIDNLNMMIGQTWTKRFRLYFQITWTVTAPISCIVIFALCIYNYSELTYKRPYHPTYIFPEWGVAIGWVMTATAVIWIPLVATYKVFRLLWMGGRLTKTDFRLLLVPYSLSEHQKRPVDIDEPCLAKFEKMSKRQSGDLDYFQDKPQWLILDDSVTML